MENKLSSFFFFLTESNATQNDDMVNEVFYAMDSCFFLLYLQKLSLWLYHEGATSDWKRLPNR